MYNQTPPPMATVGQETKRISEIDQEMASLGESLGVLSKHYALVAHISLVSGDEADIEIIEWLREKLTTLVEQARDEQKWQVHEVHGEGGKTLDGQTLYWAKVRAARTISSDNKNV